MNRHADHAKQLADMLIQAEASGEACEPLRNVAKRLGWETTQENAYSVQRIVTAHRKTKGDRIVGRKIGLTAKSVQKQLGVDEPDYGCLWSSQAHGDGEVLKLASFIEPKLEAEVALVLERDVTNADATLADLINATAYALPAFEIVDSHIGNWDIKLFDTVSDNASGAGYVLGAEPRRLDQLSLRDAKMTLWEDQKEVSTGSGGECMGHPLNAATWLARRLAEMGDPFRAGDIILTGALGPMVGVKAGARYEMEIQGLGRVKVEFE